MYAPAHLKNVRAIYMLLGIILVLATLCYWEVRTMSDRIEHSDGSGQIIRHEWEGGSVETERFTAEELEAWLRRHAHAVKEAQREDG